MKYRVRIPELRAIEGWYDTGRYRFKVSCRFNDIIRCSETNHFTSCFRKGRMHESQPFLRCVDPTWVVIYVPDKHGNFLGRSLAQYVAQPFTGGQEPHLRVDKIYGNQLTFEDIKIMLKHITCRYSGTDTYLEGRLQ